MRNKSSTSWRSASERQKRTWETWDTEFPEAKTKTGQRAGKLFRRRWIRAREQRFLAELVKQFLARRIPDFVAFAQLTRADRDAVMRAAATAAEYRVSTERAHDLMRLPVIQQRFQEELERAGLGVGKRAEIIAEIAIGGEGVKPADRMRAIDMATRLTTGYAPTRSDARVLHGRSDQLFDPKVFSETAEIVDAEFKEQTALPAARKGKAKR